MMTAGDGRGAVTLPTRPPPSIATICSSPGILSFPSLSPSAVFSPSRIRWTVVPPEAGRLLRRGGVTTSGGPARSQPKRGNRWLLAHADGHGDFKQITRVAFIRRDPEGGGGGHDVGGGGKGTGRGGAKERRREEATQGCPPHTAVRYPK